MEAQILENDIQLQCRFCNPPDKERILFETDNFYIMLSLGPIVEGYLLINSKQHIDCCGALHENSSLEFDYLANEVKRILSTIYGGCVFYEHGRAGSCLQFSEASQHCFHAHMHCVPVNIKLNNLIENSQPPINVDSWSDFRSKYRNNPQPYLFVDDGQKEIHYINREIRKQYLRYLISREVGEPELWDWVNHQGLERIQNAKTKLVPFFASLPKYIDK